MSMTQYIDMDLIVLTNNLDELGYICLHGRYHIMQAIIQADRVFVAHWSCIFFVAFCAQAHNQF